MDDPKTQSEKFKEAARALECDDDPEHFRERVGKLVRHKAVRTVGEPDVRDDGGLEAEADAMAARAMKHKPVEKPE